MRYSIPWAVPVNKDNIDGVLAFLESCGYTFNRRLQFDYNNNMSWLWGDTKEIHIVFDGIEILRRLKVSTFSGKRFVSVEQMIDRHFRLGNNLQKLLDK